MGRDEEYPPQVTTILLLVPRGQQHRIQFIAWEGG
jgi:hypothetical protein